MNKEYINELFKEKKKNSKIVKQRLFHQKI